MSDYDQYTVDQATHLLHCSHCCRWEKFYTMRCILLGTTKSGNLKLLVFGERNWRGRDHIKRVRYVSPDRVSEIPKPKGNEQ